MLLPVIDAADAGDALLLAMSQAEGGALADVSFPLAEAEAVPALVDIATGLQDLHSILILHRDLKPANVLRHSGRWKLADFGIARDQEIGTQEPTFAGGGTPYYMAPELWELKSPTVKTDLYAFGCLGYELLAGVRPYIGDLMAIRAGHLTQAPPQAPCSDAVLKNLISRLMAKRPGERPQDARAVLERLRRALVARAPVQEAIARGLGTHAAEQSTARPPRTRAASWWPRPRQTCARSSVTRSATCRPSNRTRRLKSKAMSGDGLSRASPLPPAKSDSASTCGKEGRQASQYSQSRTTRWSWPAAS